jgi:hypothetical protein
MGGIRLGELCVYTAYGVFIKLVSWKLISCEVNVQ